MNILYIGDSNSSSTSGHRAQALIRLQHRVEIKDPYKAFATQLDSRFLGPLHYRTGYRLLQGGMLKWVTSFLPIVPKPDLIWVDSGELLGSSCLASLKQLACPVIVYNVDDPTGKRDGHRFDLLIKALPLYDLVAVVRRETEEECKKLGAKKVIRLLRSYDEIAHAPFPNRDDIPTESRSEVAFIGTWMRHENRDEFLLQLLEQGVPISIWGNRWDKSPHWSKLQGVYRGGAVEGRQYVGAMQGAKLCLGLLSKGNRDLHTQRSLEVPFAGGLFCAERTSEHQEMYKEGIEAVFWADAEECARVCHKLLQDDELREEIRAAGIRRVKDMQVGNEDACRKVLAAAFSE